MERPTGFWSRQVTGPETADVTETGHIGLVGRVIKGLEAISAAGETTTEPTETRHALEHELGRLAAHGIGVRMWRGPDSSTRTHFEATLECTSGETAGLRITSETPTPAKRTWKAVVREPGAGARTQAVAWRDGRHDGLEEELDRLTGSIERTDGEADLQTLNEVAKASVRITDPERRTAAVLADPATPLATRRCSAELLGALTWIDAWSRQMPKRGAGGLQALVRRLSEKSSYATIQLTYQPNGTLLEAGVLIQTRGTPSEQLLAEGNRVMSRPNWTTAWAGVRAARWGELQLETQGTGRIALATLDEQKHGLGDRERVRKVLTALATHPEVAERGAIEKVLTESTDSATWVPLVNRQNAFDQGAR